jgi:GGDEF domain-containing protein
MGRVNPAERALFAQLGQQRYGSFAEAAGFVVSELAGVLPGTVALGRLEPGDSELRLIEVGGVGMEGLERGARLQTLVDGVDPDALRVAGARDWISSPLVISNGGVAGVLLGVDSQPSSYDSEHQALLGVAARILSLEYEGVELRSKLRRLRGLVNAGPTVDPATGLPNRESFSQLLEHEWQLAQRGTVTSMLLVCRVAEEREAGGAPGPRTSVALKVAAEVLDGSTRETDRVGRIGDTTLGAILVGCPPEDTPSFVARFLSALERVGGERTPEIEVSCGVHPLDAASTPDEVLGLAEAAAVQSHVREGTVALGVEPR